MGLLAGFGQSQPGVLAEIGLRGFTDTVPRELVVAIVEHGVDQTSRVAFAQSGGRIALDRPCLHRVGCRAEPAVGGASGGLLVLGASKRERLEWLPAA